MLTSTMPQALQPECVDSRSPSIERDKRIDSAKALAIVLVVLGHARGMPDNLVILFFSFHVPLFFLLSGWVVGLRQRQRPLGELAKKLFQNLLIPFFIFYIFGYLYWLVTCTIPPKAEHYAGMHWWEPLRGLITGSGPDSWVQPTGWFLPALFATSLSFAWLSQRLSSWMIVAVAGTLSIVLLYFFPDRPHRLPYSLDLLPTELLFFSLGSLVPKVPIFRERYRWTSFLCAIICFVPWFYLAPLNGKVDMNYFKFGHSTTLFHFVALLGSAMTIFAARFFETFSWVNWLGRNTLLILCTHIFVFFFASGIMQLVKWPATALSAFAISFLALLLAPALKLFFNRWFPLALGQLHSSPKR